MVTAATGRAEPVAGAAAGRCGVGRRAGDVACRTGWAEISVPLAHDGERQAGTDEDDGRARLDECRPWLAGQGDDAATGGLEPATPCRAAAPQARSAVAAGGSCRAGAAAAELCRGRSPSRGVG